ncbi:MAG: hypothetical protein AAF616_09380 [Bacteroidota bacterium]
MNRITSIFLSALVIVSLSLSCSTSNKGEKTAEDLEEQKTLHDIDQLIADMPPPSLVPFTLREIGAPFDDNHTNALASLTRYVGDQDKMALNMGVYASDVSYLAAYSEEEACLAYLEAAQSLAEELGDTSIFDANQINKFKGHIQNGAQDEIANLLSELFLETSVQLEEDHHLAVAGLALTGSFVEGLYQALITIEKSDNSDESKEILEPLVKVVLSEEKALLDIMQVLDDLPYDETIGKLQIELSILDRLYKGDLKEIQLELTDNPEYVVSKNEVRDILLEVKRIRASIVE